MERLQQNGAIRAWSEAAVDALCVAIAAGRSYRSIAAELGVCRGAICGKVSRLRALGDERIDQAVEASGRKIRRPLKNRGSFQRLMAPDNFAAVAATMTLYEARIYFDRSDEVLRRWAGEAGISFRRIAPAAATSRSECRPAFQHPQRDMTRVGQAVDHLRKFGPVYRCTVTGAADARGQFWSRNGFILSDDDLIERAQRLGWDENAWRRVA